MQRMVIEVKKVIHNICERCNTDLTESGECVCDELSKELLDALQTA